MIHSVWKSTKMSHLSFSILTIFNELLFTQNVNIACYARNVEWDFFCDFQTLCQNTFLKIFERKGRKIANEASFSNWQNVTKMSKNDKTKRIDKNNKNDKNWQNMTKLTKITKKWQND